MASHKVQEAKREHQEACDQLIGAFKDKSYKPNEKDMSDKLGSAKIFNTVMGMCDGYFTIASNPY